jgi:hypothetical protein
MDVIAASKYLYNKKDNETYQVKTIKKALGAPFSSGGASTGNITMIIAVCLMVTSAYLSWSSNGEINQAIRAKISPNATVGFFSNLYFALSAGLSPMTYLMYYYFAKLPRLHAIRSAV